MKYVELYPCSKPAIWTLPYTVRTLNANVEPPPKALVFDTFEEAFIVMRVLNKLTKT